jgi:hypothetical protein
MVVSCQSSFVSKRGHLGTPNARCVSEFRTLLLTTEEVSVGVKFRCSSQSPEF